MSSFIAAQWCDPDQTCLLATRADGVQATIPADPANADYRLIAFGRAEDARQAAIEPMAIAAAPSGDAGGA